MKNFSNKRNSSAHQLWSVLVIVFIFQINSHAQRSDIKHKQMIWIDAHAPHILSNQAHRTTFRAFIGGNFSYNFRIAGDFYAGPNFRYAMYQTRFAFLTPRRYIDQAHYIPGVTLAYAKSSNEGRFIFMPNLNLGFGLIEYYNINRVDNIGIPPPCDVDRLSFNGISINPNISLLWYLDDDEKNTAVGFTFGYNITDYSFSPESICMQNDPILNEISSVGISQFFNVGVSVIIKLFKPGQR